MLAELVTHEAGLVSVDYCPRYILAKFCQYDKATDTYPQWVACANL